ncbi:MAG: epoxyqueuosine reductase QueH [Candidatus Omnitrophica bacterium]|nr:epoxyqueuosine reductase QueH [Candidatus Omnitrophota bacterium]
MTDPALLQVPGDEKKVLLHCCCAPCSASILRRMLDRGLEPSVFFYNPNIYPRSEYEHRKSEMVRHARKLGVPLVDADYDDTRWLEMTSGREEEPERGRRCDLCFEIRLRKTAAYASREGFRVFASSLAISRWKDLEQVTRAGRRAAALFPGVAYWEHNWRLQGGVDQMERIAREEAFYRQKYCGCIYSLRGSIRRNLLKLSDFQSTS